MKNLTTRKIVLGLLVGLVLALGVQGTADAIDTFTPGFAPVDLSNRDAGETIVVSNFATTVNLANVREYVSLSVSGGGANFPNPTDNTKTVTSYTWRETDTNTNDGTNHNDATLPSIGSQTITVNSPGEVTVTVSYTETYNTNQSRTTSVVSTYYVVKSGIDVNPNDAVSLLGVSNGVGAGYDHRKDIKIHSADSRYNQVTYTVNNGATLYIKEGNRDNKSGRAADANLITSSSADVWLSLVDNSSQVTAKLDRGGNTKNQALYIYGRPTLRVTAPSTNPPLLSGDPGQRRAVSDSPITIVIYDQTTGGAVDTTAVSGAPIKFDVADKSTTGGYLIPPPSVDSDTDLFSDNITDANGNLLRHSSLGSLLPSRTLYVRSSATVGFQFGTVPGTSEVTVSLSGTNVNLTEKITVRVTGGDIMTLSESSNRRRSSDSKLFDLVALVEEYGKPPALGTVGGNPGRVSVTFRASQGTLTSTPADETETSDASDTGTNLIANTGRFITEYVDANGRAQVIYNLGGNTGRQEIYASINDNNAETRKEIIFIVNGPAAPSGGGGGGGEPPSQTPRLTITSSTGTGTDRSVTVTATNAQGAVVPGLFVTLRGTALPDGSQDVRAGEATPITLPSTPDTYTLTATAPGYTSDTEGFTIEAPGTLAITAVGARSGTQQQITVTASGRTIPSGGVVVTLQGVTNPRTVTIQSGSTSVSRIATLPSASSPHTVTATAVGYNDAPPLTIPAPGQQPTTTTTTTTTTQTGTAGVADSIEIDGDRQRSGTVNQVLRLRARVLDANDNGVSGVRVTFRVLAPGQGRLSQRGNGRATQVETDRSGYATASLTPLGGNLIVEAKAAQVTASVTFIIDVGGGTGGTETDTDATASTPSPQTYNVGDKVPISLEGTLSFTNPRTLGGITYTCVGDGECVVSYGLVTKGQIQAAPAAKTTPPRAYQVGDKIPISLEDTLTFTGKHTVNGTSYTCVGDGECVVSYGLVTKGQIEVTTATAATPHTSEIMPEVLLGADRRPPMVWVDGGKFYALVGAAVHAFAPAVENVMNIAVSGDMLYWTQMTGKNAGTINAMHLDGTGAKELVSIHAVPRGIAVDSVAKRLYWTNSQGWIQSSNLEGTARRNVISGGLEDPLGIRVGNGWLYWTQGDGRLQAVNLTGTQAVRTLATGMQSAEGLAVFENKVYWTQMTGRNAGTINAVNLDGTGAKALVSIQAVPRGIVVDGVAKRLYWTNSQGWIQSSNLEGTARRNVAKGLGSPGGIALSATLEVSVMAEKDAASPTAAAPNYDVDGSGTVDNADLFLVSLAVGTDNAQYDVNGDGTVNDKDIALVRDNRDNGAAAAPMVFGVKLTAEQVGRLQAQIDLLIVSGDRSPAALKTLVYLQQLIATARPEKTQLLANYPNPFNPETWIPYELATDTDVRITIYAANGVVVRTLQLGQQSAGYYTDRERAAYWDGRNASGEQVASGVYFYQLETDEISSLRKMVILK